MIILKLEGVVCNFVVVFVVDLDHFAVDGGVFFLVFVEDVR